MTKSITDVTRFIGEHSADRRTFLKGAGIAGLGGLAAGTLPFSSAFAQSQKVVAIMPGVFIPDPARPAEWDTAWQSQSVGDITAPCAGELSVPRQWLQPALWAP